MELSWNQDKYLYASRFAAEAHKGQCVPGAPGLPYIVHVTWVCMEVIAALQSVQDLDGNLAIQCALLHDVIEDAHVTFEQISSGFGEAVARGVLALSKHPDLDKPLQMADCLRRIRQQPREVWMVKLADRVTNLQPPPKDWALGKRISYQKEASEILNTLGSASEFLAIRLLAKIKAYNQYLGN